MLDLNTVELIMAGAMGLTVVGVTEIIKRWLDPAHKSKILGYAISLVVSAGATAYYLLTAKVFTVPLMIGYTLLVFAVANGIFKSAHTPTNPQ